MITLIFGGSGSGKSAYAEAYVEMLSNGNRKYYLATMQVFDKEGEKKIERHQKLRCGKGFITIEQPLCIHEALEKMKGVRQESEVEALTDSKLLRTEATALLECMSNLVANEMFSGENPISCEIVVDKIIKETEQLGRGLKHLVIVTNNVFEDGVSYDESTMDYIRAMGKLNEKLVDMADKVVEVVVGIPLILKEGN